MTSSSLSDTAEHSVPSVKKQPHLPVGTQLHAQSSEIGGTMGFRLSCFGYFSES